MTTQEQGSARVEASASAVFGILVDYARYREWMPDVRESQALISEGDITIVELAWSRFGDEPIALEMIETPSSSLLFTQVDQYRRGLSGHWDLRREGDATEVRLLLSSRDPFYLRPRAALRQTVQDCLDALQHHAARAATSSEVAIEHTKLFEVVRRGRGLEIRLQGKVFVLDPTPGDDGPGSRP